MTDVDPFGRGRVRRLFGLDRSGDKPRPTRSGEPLNPWTIPNLIGYLRLAGIPVFLVLAYSTGDGRSTASATIFWLIAAGDYVDGFLARALNQYSRMGALMDPFIDRLTVISGAVVCWSFHLLPRWALIVLALREIVMLGLAEYGLRHGVDLAINWPGRIAVFWIMAGIFFAQVFAGWVPTAFLLFGLFMALIATALYAREGFRAGRAAKAAA
jgi:cardiolipin synthase (CMP-forming)